MPRAAEPDTASPSPDRPSSSSGPWAVYLLACARGTSYVGISPRPDERYLAHNAGRGGAFTRANPPERCVRVVWFDDRRAAASLEARLKHVSRVRKWAWFTGFPDTTPTQAATLELGLARLARIDPARTLAAP